ncbi:hypothetical protein SLS55_001527 [Diplodia seriata]|uniref:Uncharacterized protein n=1 Tax=Diplodia seriata TaxID=420778 RepID=A0ABR3CPJ8_9PEZI
MADTQSDDLDAYSSDTLSNSSEPSTMPQEHPKKDIEDLSFAELMGHIRRLVEIEDCDPADGAHFLRITTKKNRCYFLDRYIRKHGDALNRALGVTKREPGCDWATLSDKSLQVHLLIAVEADAADVYADTILINFFSLHSRIEREAFQQIYGVSVKDARRMEQIPGMSHVLNLRANAHLYPDVFNIEAFRSTIELDTTIAIIQAHVLLESNEMPPTLPEIIRKLSFYSIRPSTGWEGPALLLHVTGH